LIPQEPDRPAGDPEDEKQTAGKPIANDAMQQKLLATASPKLNIVADGEAVAPIVGGLEDAKTNVGVSCR
jgi:hypothetical protein